MTDLQKAIAVAREALVKYQDREVRHYLDEAMEGLLAALDAEAPPAAVPLAELHAALALDIDIMRDVYMTRSQQEAFDRIKAAAQRKESD